jgi:ankyrin repeat protein
MVSETLSAANEMRAALTCFSPSWDVVIELAKTKGMDVTEVSAGPDDDCALHFAAYWGEHEVILELLAIDADINARNRLGSTPIHLAAMNGKCDTIRLLVEKGADLTLFDEEGNTAIHTACSVGDAAAVDALLSCGADPVARNSINGNTPCHISAREGFSGICTALAARRGASAVFSACNDAGEQPLHRAASHGQRDVVASLSKLGADISAVDANGDGALHLAAIFGMTETASELLSSGANPNAEDDDKQTPLHLACTFKQVPTACMLIRAGAKWDLSNAEGQSSQTIAVSNSLRDVLDCIDERAKCSS